MKKICLALTIALLLLVAAHGNSFAQTSGSSTEDATASLGVSKNILKIIGALAKDFADQKGDLITKTDDGTSVYGVKDIGDMMAANEYIMVKSGGAMYYIASYKDDEKKLGMSFAAFTGGVITVTNADGNFSVQQDKEKSTSTTLVYILSVKGNKVGSYSMDVKAKSGTMIIGFL